MRAYLNQSLTIISFSSCLVSHVALGQISPDGTLQTQVEANPQEIKITGGTQVGKNLFHSFNEFSPMGSAAYFDNSITIDNIISRVTGGKVSLIDGLIKANGTANLLIINPLGFVFGPNAKLDLGGSFIASSASSIRFSDGHEFGVNHPESSLLTVAVPVGLQFGQTPPGSIINRSQSLPLNNNDSLTFSGLEVKSDKTLALIGGNVTLDNGNLTAFAGKIELGSVAENSYVSLTPIEKGWQFGYQGVQNFLDVLLTQKSFIDASDNGGTVQIQGRHIKLNQGSQIVLIPINDIRTGDLIINGTESVELIDLKNINQSDEFIPTGLFVFGGNVDGGKVVINTQKFSLKDGALIDVETGGAGKGGDILINASESVEIIGTSNVESSLLLTATSGTGQGGNIVIDTKSLVVRDGGQITADTVINQGQGGIISINAQNTVEVIGQGITPSDGLITPSLISASSGDRLLNISGFGDGGSINIKTHKLIVRDGAQITVESFQTEDFDLKTGAAGIISVKANSILLDNQSQLNAIAENNTGNGGEINLTASDRIELRNNSSITAEVNSQGGLGNGGNIKIDTPFIIAVPRENSDIVAVAKQGNGGNIHITASGFFGIQVQQGERIALSEINASSETGISGVITINRPDVDSQGNLATLPTQVINTDNLIVESCRTGVQTAGEFSIKGRGGLPIDPNQTISLNQGLADLGNPSSQAPSHSDVSVRFEAEKPYTEPIIEAQGWLTNEQGQIILTAQATTVTPQGYNNPTKCSGP